MELKDSRPSNASMSSSSISHTGHKNGARQNNEGSLTSASLIPQSAKMTKKKQASMIHKCADCEYETTVRQNFGTHRMCHDVKSAHKCPWCSFSSSSMRTLAVHVRYYHTKTDKKALATEKQSNSVAKKRAEEWHTFPSGRRLRYKFCVDCNHKSITNLKLDVHMRLMHPFSATALQSLNLKDEKHKYNCAHCPFKTNEKTKFERHDACHGNQSANHHCHLCDYSVNHRGHLALHLKLHCREMEENNIGDQPIAGKDRDYKITSRTSRNSRRSLLSCGDCRLFKTTSRFTLKRHVKRAHPFSLSALPPLSKKRKGNGHHLNKSGIKVARKAHQVEVMRPSHHTDEMPLEKKTIIPLLKCLECDYSTIKKGNMDTHKKNHQRDGKLKCPHCSFSSDLRSSLVLHCKHVHQGNLKLLDAPARIQEGPSEARLRKQFGIIKECKVVLQNIQPLPIEVVSPKNTELLPPNNADQIMDVPSPENAEILLPNNDDVYQLKDENEVQQERNAKIQLLQSRLKITEERARTINEEMKEISSKKIDVQKKIDEIEGKRALIECNLRSEQSDLKEMITSALESGEEPSEMLKQSAEEEIKCLEDEIKLTDGELQALKEEEKSLNQKLENARCSHFGVVQVLRAVQTELDGLLLHFCV